MNRILWKPALGITFALLSIPSLALAGRGGGYGGGAGRGGGGAYRGSGQMGGGSMAHSPSFSQPHSSGSYGSGSQSGSQAGAHSNATSAAAGAGYANHNNQSSQYPHAGAAGAAAGAGYANHNNQSSQYPHAGAAGAAAGAGYANNHNGTWNGNNYAGWGATGMGMGYPSGVAAWGAGSPMYGWGYSGYSNPYSGGIAGAGGVPQAAVAQQPAAGPGSNYAQPISTSAPPPEQPVLAQADKAYDQAREAFKGGDYDQALELAQQALGQTPNDTTLHEFLALAFFAKGKYEQAAAPLYAVLSVRPGWDWTTLSGMYADVDTYTGQLRALEAFVRANPSSAQPRFVLAYQYLSQGHDPEAIAQLNEVVKLQPGDTLSAQIIAQFQPSGGSQPPPSEAAPAAPGKLAGTWAAAPAAGVKIALAIGDDGAFTWAATGPGKPAMNIAGKSTFADQVLTLTAQGGQNGALVGKVAWQDAENFTFRVVGAPPNDPGLKFTR